MKPLLTALLLFAIIAFAADTPRTVSPVGRFQLVTGTVQKDIGPIPIIIKIDTSTGDTWQLEHVPTGVKTGYLAQTAVLGWNRLNDDAYETAQTVRRLAK